ncbi:MAG: hypothetical protein ACWGQW_04000 [bacterium]
MDEFFRTAYGRRFFEHQLPSLIRALESFTKVMPLFQSSLEAAEKSMQSMTKVLEKFTHVLEPIAKEVKVRGPKQEE